MGQTSATNLSPDNNLKIVLYFPILDSRFDNELWLKIWLEDEVNGQIMNELANNRQIMNEFYYIGCFI